MSTVPWQTVIRHLYRTVGTARHGALSDAELLRRWQQTRDEAAFEVLIWRHGALVWNVCRRRLGNEQDAEDAFQATFLTLVHKASSIGKPEALPSWLYKVAYRAALAARERRRHTNDLPETLTGLEDDPAVAAERAELRSALDEEVNRLPDKYRLPFVLCYLEGRTTDEAAAHLGFPRGTIGTRLAWARERLRERLARRGILLSSGSLAVWLAQDAASAAVPVALVADTVRSALVVATGSAAAGILSTSVAAITQGVLRTMLVAKVKFAMSCLIVFGLLTASVGVLSTQLLSEQPALALLADKEKPAPNAHPEKNVAGNKDGDKEAPVQKPADNREKPSKEGDKPKKEAPSVQGTLKTIDASNNSITLTVRTNKETSEDQTFSVAGDARIFVASKEAGTLADLKPGMRVLAQLSADGKSVQTLKSAPNEVKGVGVQGTLKGVDANKRNITVTVADGPEKGATADKTYELADDVRVFAADKENGSLADLKPGAYVFIKLDPERKTAVAIKVGGPKKGDDQKEKGKKFDGDKDDK
ncbi:MAG: RNA polymerase sigma factor [Gemmataceae bacterium]